MIFQPGTYYIGDPGFVLPNDDLRALFSEFMHKGFTPGPKELVTSIRWDGQNMICDYYWIATMPSKKGTLYDQNNQGWGFDWGCFGAVPWKWVNHPESYESNKIEFAEPFECFFTEDSITIGHLHFTFNPK